MNAETEAKRRRWIAMATLLIASFMNMIDVTIVNVAMPSLQRAFDATSSQIEWVVAAYIMTFAVGLLPFGRMGDILGKRRVFVWGVMIFTVGSALCGLAPTMQTLIAARVLQGIGGAMMVPQTLAIAQVLFPPQERAAAFSLFGLVAGLASVTGPAAGGLLIDANLWDSEWRSIFLVNIPIGVFAILAARKFIPDLAGTEGMKGDPGGIALAAATVFLMLFPLIEGRELGWPWWAFAMMAASVVSAFLFFRWEKTQARENRPQLLPVSLLSNRNFLLGTALSTILFAGVPGFFLVLAIYLQVGNGLTPLQSGITTMPFSIGVLVASIISGKLGTRWPRRRITAGALLLAISMIAVRLVVEHMGVPLNRIAFSLPLLAGGIGLGVAISPMFQTVLANVNPKDAGSGSGALQSFQQAGGALGVALIGQIFFSHVTSGFAAGGAPSAVFGNALQLALLYNIAAFTAIAILVRLLPKPQLRAPGAMPHPAPPAEV